MKKTVLRALCAAIALILVVSLTGCGVVGALLARSDSSSSEAEPTPTPAPKSTPTPEPASQSPTQGSAEGMYATVREFMDDNRETLDASIRQMTNDDMDIVLDGTTDRLIYQFTFSESAMEDVDEEALIGALEEGLDESGFVSTFQNIADSVKEVVTVDSVKIDVIYCRYDGKELAKRTFVSGSSSAAAAAPETSGTTMSGYLEAHRDELNEALAGEVENSDEISSMVLDATDDTLIYRITFDDAAIAGIPDEQLTDALYEALDGEGMTDYFNALTVMIRTESGVSSAKISINYVKSDGTILAAREYTGK